MPILYALILWSFLIQLVGSTITTNHCCSTPQCSPILAQSRDRPYWTAIAWLIGLGVIATLVDQLAFDRRDLVAA